MVFVADCDLAAASFASSSVVRIAVVKLLFLHSLSLVAYVMGCTGDIILALPWSYGAPFFNFGILIFMLNPEHYVVAMLNQFCVLPTSNFIVSIVFLFLFSNSGVPFQAAYSHIFLVHSYAYRSFLSNVLRDIFNLINLSRFSLNLFQSV